MKRVQSVVLAALLVTATSARATPSTVFWTPATSYTQPFLVPHLTYDSYVAELGALQNDYGLTVGVIPSDKVQGEVGLDLFLPGYLKNTTQLNAKLALVEGAFGKWQPGISAGIMNVGFEKDVSDYHLLHAEASKLFPFGTVGAGVYYGAGSKLLWTNSDGDVQRLGVMGSYVSPDFVLDLPGLQKVVFAADLATGKNWFGAVGGGAALYFTPAVSLLTGPVWFLDGDLYEAGYGTDFMWTVQLDIDFDLMKKKG